MRGILKKTLGPNFRAGDIIVGENKRIKRLNEKGLVTLDHSMLAMFGNIITIILAALLIVFSLLTIFPFFLSLTERWTGYAFEMSWLWRATIIIISVIAILINISYFLGNKIPYVTYFFSFSLNIIGGVLIMIGHERSSAKYQPSSMSTFAAVSLFFIGALMFGIALTANITFILQHGDIEKVRRFGIWLAFIVLLVSGLVISIFFDMDYSSRRIRYIGFLKNRNAIVEYKTKALNAFRTYQKTGNAEKFMEKNIDLLEKTLEIDRQEIDSISNKK